MVVHRTDAPSLGWNGVSISTPLCFVRLSATPYVGFSRYQEIPTMWLKTPHRWNLRMSTTTIPHPDEVSTLHGLFQTRVRCSPERPAYRYFHDGEGGWRTLTWRQAAAEVERWRTALAGEGLAPGDRVAVMMRNRPEWVFFEQAALALGLVVVPLYPNDRGENLRYILEDAGVRLLLIEGAPQWRALSEGGAPPAGLRLIALAPPPEADLSGADDWLAAAADTLPDPVSVTADDLATLVYTSGTTGRPKGVMLSHGNILHNAYAALQVEPAREDDVFLSFLPLSHMLERTAGYYLPMAAGACVAFARSVQHLAEDLLQVRPTVVILVPRVLERIYGRIDNQLTKRPLPVRALFRLGEAAGWAHFLRRQGRGGSPLAWLWPLLRPRVAAPVLERFGGRLRLAVSGGAPLPIPVARRFIGLGLPILQGYGLTEASPVVSVNRLDDNRPEGVGRPLPGMEIRLGPQNELWVRGPSIMQGYWKRPEDTAAMLDSEGWLHTGDQATVEEDGHLRITGRIKEILVLSNGEKVPPVDMELALELEPLFEQAMVVGDGRPFLTAVLVVSDDHWRELAARLELDPEAPESLEDPRVRREALRRAQAATRKFPGYARIRGVVLERRPWTVEDGLLTPTLKLRRGPVMQRYRGALELLYARR